MLATSARHSPGSPTCTSSAPVKDREGIDNAVREFEHEGVDGLLVVMLTYGPAMRVARAFAETRLPICLLNIQPVPEITADWDMSDLTYNQGIHGAQDTANAMVRAGRPFHVITRRLAASRRSSRPSDSGREPRQPSAGGAASRSRSSGMR